jgi:hypothetical protein
MTAKKKITRFGPSIASIAVGMIFIITKGYPISIVGPVERGGLVVFIGVLLCLLGAWGILGTLKEEKKQAQKDRTSRHEAP